MNLLQLVLKQMRQRALSTWLTLLSVILGSALAIGVLILRRESTNLFVQTDFGYDLIVAMKASPMQVVLNTVYHVDVSPGNIPYVLYEGLRNNKAMIKHAVPYVVGDTYHGFRVAGTSPSLFGFDDTTGQPLKGYDDRGHLKPGFERPTGEDAPTADLTRQVAASTFEYRLNKKFTLAQGRMFHPMKFEAIIGADVAEKSGLKLGDTFKAAHDAPGAKASDLDEHDEQWTVVGVLDKTFTAEDRVLFIPLVSFYAIPQHEQSLETTAAAKAGLPPPTPPKKPEPKPATKPDDHDHDHDKPAATRPMSVSELQALTRTLPAAPDHDDHDHPPATKPATTAAAPKHDDHDHHDHEEAYDMNPDGTIHLHLTKDKWQLSAILLRTRGGYFNMSLQDSFRRGDSAMAVNPASVMRDFFSTFLGPSTALLLALALIVLFTAAVSILVSIYNAVSARSREIAIMRALGATRGKVLSLICLEAGVVGLLGGIIGLVIGHAFGAVVSTYFNQKMGTTINWVSTSWEEWLYLVGVVVLAVLAGLVPGLKAYRTPVATNLVAS